MKTAVCCVLGVALIGTGMARNDLCRWVCDVFGQECERARVLQPGDRVEIYRELAVDAKTARRQRAAQQRDL